jgi:hypothetical protein
MRKIIATIILFSHLTCLPFNFISNKTKEGSLSPAFLAEIVQTFKPDIFIETGTYYGGSTIRAASYFKEIYSVELDHKLYQEAKSRTASYKNIHLYHGESSQFLSAIIPQCKGTIVFWLDAHYCGEKTAMAKNNPNDPEAITPIRNELKTIAQQKLNDCIILIDDIRGFGTEINGTEYFGCWAYPCVQSICSLGREINPNFAFVLLGDTLLMYDATKYSPLFSPVVMACTKSRFYNGKNLDNQELIECEKIIMNASTAEKEFITYLYNQTTSYHDPVFCHDLWYGLINMGSGHWQEAAKAIKKIPTRVQTFNRCRETINEPIYYDDQRIKDYLMQIEQQLS